MESAQRRTDIPNKTGPSFCIIPRGETAPRKEGTNVVKVRANGAQRRCGHRARTQVVQQAAMKAQQQLDSGRGTRLQEGEDVLNALWETHPQTLLSTPRQLSAVEQ